MLGLFDIDLYMFFWGINSKQNQYWCKVPVSTAQASALLSKEISNIQLDSKDSIILGETFLANLFSISPIVIPESIGENSYLALSDESTQKEFPICFIWQHPQPWPYAFSSILAHLSLLYAYGKTFIRSFDGVAEPGYTNTSGARILPLRLYSMYYSFGEFELGLLNTPSCTIEELTKTNLFDKDTSLEEFKFMGFSETVSLSFIDSGFIPISYNSANNAAKNLELTPFTFGGALLNEYQCSIQKFFSLKEKPGYYIDSYYRGLYSAFEPKSVGLYGENGIPRFCLDVSDVDTLRLRFANTPVFEAGSLEDIKQIIESIITDQSIIADGGKFYFRGQTCQYYLHRAPEIKHFLFGKENVLEPSLRGAAPRRSLDYDDIHSLFQLLLQDWIYKQAYKTGKDLREVRDNWCAAFISPKCSWDYYVMATAQHYGIPTHGLDITSDLDVAIWFATHKLILENDSGTYRAMQINEWPDDPRLWPVIYIFDPKYESLWGSVTDIVLMDELGIKALRPERQKAYLFTGAHGIHQNRLAETLVCAIRLKPGIYETDLSYSYLFPKPEEDEIYEYLLSIKHRFKYREQNKFFNEIIDYRYD